MKNKKSRKRVLIVGATSGIGQGLAYRYIQAGYLVAIAGRREDCLQAIAKTAPKQVVYKVIDIRDVQAEQQLLELIDALGGLDLYIHVSGFGKQNKDLQLDIDITTVETNVTGFVRMVDTAYNYMRVHGGGHLAAVSSVAGTRSMGTGASYSASKAFNNSYLQALSQLSNMQKHHIQITTIKPGFVDTPILSKDKKYPMIMPVEYATHIIFKGLKSRKRIIVVDWKYRIAIAVMQCIPRWIWEHLTLTN
ncbi:MAG TPA: SDR family NAD(P)-dependent oxidoreductase [Bacteroidaceae bacterium]|nr:SDR family NAD(P)-dependent oxidoreductase [Bacteroidaceae bacterium]